MFFCRHADTDDREYAPRCYIIIGWVDSGKRPLGIVLKNEVQQIEYNGGEGRDQSSGGNFYKIIAGHTHNPLRHAAIRSLLKAIVLAVSDVSEFNTLGTEG